MEEAIQHLPPEALIPLGIVIGLGFLARWMGLAQGMKATNEIAPTVAAVVVDPTALNNARMAIEDHTSSHRENTAMQRGVSKEVTSLLKELIEEIRHLREEVRLAREISAINRRQ